MGTNPFAAAKLPSRTNTKLPKHVAGSVSREPSAKLPNRAEDAATTEPNTKLPGIIDTKLPTQRLGAAERLRRLEEAMAFLRQHLAAGPQPARTLLNAANAAGIAERTLHRAKDLLGVTTERSGGYGALGLWVWFPTAATGDAVPDAARETGALVADSR